MDIDVSSRNLLGSNANTSQNASPSLNSNDYTNDALDTNTDPNPHQNNLNQRQPPPNTTRSPYRSLSESYKPYNAAIDLTTPMRRIKELSLESPPRSVSQPVTRNDAINAGSNDMDLMNSNPDPSSVRPNTSSSFTLSSNSAYNQSSIDDRENNARTSNDIFTQMVNRGYSQTISNKVLSELNLRATEISAKIKSPPPPQTPAMRRPTNRKRYSGIHRVNFNNMDSISNHYAASRSGSASSSSSHASTSGQPSSSSSSSATSLRIPSNTRTNSMELKTNRDSEQRYRAMLSGNENQPQTSLQMSFQAQQNLQISSSAANSRSSQYMSPEKTHHEMTRSENVMDIDEIEVSTPNDEGKRNSTIDISSINKRRRTLNGPEEVLNFQLQQQGRQRDNSPTKSSYHQSSRPGSRLSRLPLGKFGDAGNHHGFSHQSPNTSQSPQLRNQATNYSSPAKSRSASPSKGISPSKGSMNLNGILNDDINLKPLNENREDQLLSQQLASPHDARNHKSLNDSLQRTPNQNHCSLPTQPEINISTQASPQILHTYSGMNNQRISQREFLKPAVPAHRVRQSSLEMAGVKPSTSHGGSNPSSASSTPRLSSAPSLQKKSSIASLNKKSSIPTLNKKPSINDLGLHKKPSISDLRQKSSIPTISRRPSSHELQPGITGTPSSNALGKRPSVSKLPRRDSSADQSSATSTRHESPNQRTTAMSPSPSSGSINGKNYTVPKPFSLYEKPTVSSSQKSLYDNSALSSSQKSLNKFQKFKNRFH